MSQSVRIIVATSLLVLAVGTLAVGDGDSSIDSAQENSRKTAKPTRIKPQLVITPEREAAVVEFLRQHHPALLDLVRYLKQHLPKEYQKAMRDLYRTHERLNGIADRGDLKKHELELKFWKTQSRVQLLTAQYRMTKTPGIRKQLEKLLNEQYDQRIMMLRYDRERVESRLQKLDRQIEDLRATQQQQVERQIQSLTKTDKPTVAKNDGVPNNGPKPRSETPPAKSATD